MPDLELYHNGLSSCSQKVRLVLAEKNLDFTSHEINLVGGEQHAPAYVKLNPNHVVPTLVHQGRALIESSLIDEYLEDAFPEVSLRPAEPGARHAMRVWVKRIDDKVHPSAGVLTYAIGPRAAIQRLSEEEREAHIQGIPDATRRAQRRSVIEHGVKAPEFEGALAHFLDLLDDMETALAASPWLSGDGFGLADIAALPYVLRMEHLAIDAPLSSAVRPRVAEWLGQVKARPSFESAVAAWAPEPILAMFRSQGEEVRADVESLVRGR